MGKPVSKICVYKDTHEDIDVNFALKCREKATWLLAINR